MNVLLLRGVNPLLFFWLAFAQDILDPRVYIWDRHSKNISAFLHIRLVIAKTLKVGSTIISGHFLWSKVRVVFICHIRRSRLTFLRRIRSSKRRRPFRCFLRCFLRSANAGNILRRRFKQADEILLLILILDHAIKYHQLMMKRQNLFCRLTIIQSWNPWLPQIKWIFNS